MNYTAGPFKSIHSAFGCLGFQGLLGEFVLSGTSCTVAVIDGVFHSGTKYPINLTL